MAETPKELNNVSTQIIGSVRELCKAAGEQAQELGYEPVLLTDHLDCEAKEAGVFLADIIRTHANDGRKLAFLAGGETVVHLTGKGKGGRNQELALAGAAGGYTDGDSLRELSDKGISLSLALSDNDMPIML